MYMGMGLMKIYHKFMKAWEERSEIRNGRSMGELQLLHYGSPLPQDWRISLVIDTLYNRYIHDIQQLRALLEHTHITKSKEPSWLKVWS